eukprot:XP_017947260.1 PREDICTED: sodium-dependent proline transporter-like isoform X2 [Xenopus tropicalis]
MKFPSEPWSEGPHKGDPPGGEMQRFGGDEGAASPGRAQDPPGSEPGTSQDGTDAQRVAELAPPAPAGPPRETWGGKYEFLLSCIGYCVGLGNVWRFPYLCYRNGGGAFLIPYSIMLFFTGLPLFLMELSLGQYGAAGPITVWKCCPILKGIGIGMLLVSALVSLYYNVIIAWTFYYLGQSFQSPLPWSCDSALYSQLCQIVYFTATFPYFVMVVLIIRGATLEGSIDGVRFYLTADWKRLQSAQVWNDAASQIFYSLGIGFGGLLSMASYNKFNNNVIRDTLVIAIGNCSTSFFAGFAIFSVLGHMAWKKGVPVGQVADSGPGLAFVAYPEALALLPGSVFWSILFFLMLFTLGVDTLFGNMEGITTAILDEIPSLRDWKRKTIFLGCLCFAFYLLGLLLITQGGIYWFTLIDSYSTSFGLIIIALFMCLGIAFFYGVNQFCQDILDMVSQCPPWCTKVLWYFKACWVFITPLLLLFILFYIFLEMYNTPLRYGAYVYPRWGQALGICMGTLCCIQIPIWATVAVLKETGTLKERFKKSLRPLNTWRNANSPQEHGNAIIDVPYTVNLTQQDFSDAVWQGAEMLED